MRISIIGLPGSGKSTLARTLSERFGVPHIHLDRFWFCAGGHRLLWGDRHGREKVRQYVQGRIEEDIQQESWVSDGFFYRMQGAITGRADILVWLDIPFLERLGNHLYRAFTQEGRHPEISFFDDILFVPEFITRTFITNPRIHRFAAEHPEKLIVLRSRDDIARFLSTLAL